MSARLALAVLAAAALVGGARPGEAQVNTRASAACVDAACGQVDLDVTRIGGAPALVDAFDVWFGANADWRFGGLQGGEAEDAAGFTFFAPWISSTGAHLAGAFDPGFEPLLQPSLRLRADVEPQPWGTSAVPSLDFVYRLAAGGRTIGAGTVGNAPASSARATCAGPAFADCSQVDFDFTIVGGLQTVDFFHLWLIGSDWLLADLQSGESSDAFGPNFFSPTVSDGGATLEGLFDPAFAAWVDPSLRVRAEFAATGAAPLRFAYLLGYDGVPITAGIGQVETSAPPGTTAPEPGTLALLGGGLLVLAAVARRSRMPNVRVP